MTAFTWGRARLFLFLGSTVGLTAAFASADITFDDGGSHTVDADFRNELVRVTGQTELVVNGRILGDNLPVREDWDWGLVEVAESSTLTVHAGQVHLTAINGGISPYAIAAADSVVRIQGGEVVRNFGDKCIVIWMDRSQLQMSGGELHALTGWSARGIYAKNSVVDLTGGAITTGGESGFSINLVDSIGTMSDGNLNDKSEWSTGIWLEGASTFDLLGGIVKSSGDDISNGILTSGSSELRIAAGTVSAHTILAGRNVAVRSLDASTVQVTGGTFLTSSHDFENRAWTFWSRDESVMTIRGGTFGGTLGPPQNEPNRPIVFHAENKSQIHVTGGRVTWEEFLGVSARDEAAITIYGSAFNLPMFEPIQDQKGIITGTLLDGNEFSWNFERDTTATIMLVPEPRSGTILGLGAVPLLILRRRHAGRADSSTLRRGLG